MDNNINIEEITVELESNNGSQSVLLNTLNQSRGENLVSEEDLEMQYLQVDKKYSRWTDRFSRHCGWGTCFFIFVIGLTPIIIRLLVMRGINESR